MPEGAIDKGIEAIHFKKLCPILVKEFLDRFMKNFKLLTRLLQGAQIITGILLAGMLIKAINLLYLSLSRESVF